DGRRITFMSDREGDRSIFWQPADGSGTAERLSKAEAAVDHRPEAWSPDGKILSFRTTAQLGDIWMLPRTGDQKPAPFLATGVSEGFTAFSPNGQWLAYTSGENRNRANIFVQPFPPTGSKYQISTEGGTAPLWSPDGKQLFYVSLLGQLVAVDIRTQPTFSFGKPITIPIERWVINTNYRNYDITPDGKHFVTVTLGSSADDPAKRPTQQINAVLNWFSELQQRVPVK